ncbi:MAG: hypothetical protein QW275_03035, partial [Candidatus Anstonellaceae archaeon]
MIDFISFAYPNFFSEPLLISAFLFATSSIALSWMASEFFSMPSLKAFAKQELRELGITLLVVLLAIGLVMPDSLFDIVGKGMVPNPPYPNCPEANPTANFAFNQAAYFLGCKVSFSEWTDYFTFGVFGSRPKGILMPDLMDAYRELMGYEIATGFLSTFTFGIPLTKGLIPAFPVDFI